MRPRILGFLTVGRMLFSMFSVSVVLCCAGSGVNRVVVVLEALRVNWLALVQLCICWRYG